MGRLKIPALLLIILFLCVFALLPQPTFADSVVEKFPTETSVVVAGWTNPTNAYSINEMITDTITDKAEQEYSGFGFSLNESSTILGVFVKIWGYSTIDVYGDFNDMRVNLNTRVYNGSWINKTALTHYSQAQGIEPVASTVSYHGLGWGSPLIIDFSADVTSVSQLNNIKIRVWADQVVYTTGTFHWSVDAVSVEVAYTTPTEENLRSPSWFLSGEIIAALIIVPMIIIIFAVIILKKKH